MKSTIENKKEIQGKLVFNDNDSYNDYINRKANFNNGLRRSDGTLYRQPDFIEYHPIELNDAEQNLSEHDRYIAMFICYILAPIVEAACDKSIYHIDKWVEEKVIPDIKARAKAFIKDAKIISIGIRSAILGEKTKASKVIDDSLKQEKLIKLDTVDTLKIEINNSNFPVINEEAEKIINCMRFHALYLANDIRKLSQLLVKNNCSKANLKYQQELEGLLTNEVMMSVSLLLKNSELYMIDEDTTFILSEFYKGNLVVNGKSKPITNFISL